MEEWLQENVQPFEKEIQTYRPICLEAKENTRKANLPGEWNID